MEDLGFQAEIAGTAATAMNKLALLRGDLAAGIVISAYPTPGASLVNERRALYPHLPVIISSGHDKATLQSQFSAEQNMQFLSKPFTAE